MVRELEYTSIIPGNDLTTKVHIETISEQETANAQFELLQQWHSQPRKMRIIRMGASATGLYAALMTERALAYRLRARLL